MKENELIRFDYAAKNILRDKSNFSILEGLVSAVLGEDIHIEELLESESNPERKDDKFNRVDIKAKDSRGDSLSLRCSRPHSFSLWSESCTERARR